MKKRTVSLMLIVFLFCMHTSAQNVGINKSNPSEPLEVGGMIYSSADGYKFPDGSVQTRASSNFPASDASGIRGLIIMEIDNIPGPLTFQNVSDGVKLLDFNWKASRTYTLGGGGGSGSPPAFEDLSILKEIDKTSVPLMKEFFDGDAIQYVKFYFYLYDSTASNWFDYYRVTLTHANVTSVNQFTEFAGNENYRHLETITFVFEEIEFEYRWWDKGNPWQYIYDLMTGGGS